MDKVSKKAIAAYLLINIIALVAFTYLSSS